MNTTGMDLPGDAHYRRCAGAVIFNAQGLVWVGERCDTPGAWQMPQGGIDDGESPRDAAIREVHEETGTDSIRFLAEGRDWLRYDLPPQLLGKAWGGRWRGQIQKWFAFRFTGEDGEFDIAGVAHPEFDRWQWVELAELPSLIVPFKRPVYEAVVQEFRHLATPD